VFNHTNINITNNVWVHNPAHRGNVPYRNAAVAARFGRGNETAARDAFRDRAGVEHGDLFRDHPAVLPNDTPRDHVDIPHEDASRDHVDMPREDASRDHADVPHVDPQREDRARAGDDAKGSMERRDADFGGDRGDRRTNSMVTPERQGDAGGTMRRRMPAFHPDFRTERAGRGFDEHMAFGRR